LANHEITITSLDSSQTKAKFAGPDRVWALKLEIARQTGVRVKEIELFLEGREEPIRNSETIEEIGFPCEMWLSKKAVRVKVSSHTGHERPRELTEKVFKEFCDSDGKNTNIIDLNCCKKLRADGLGALLQCVCLQELFLSKCSLGRDEIRVITNLLEENESLYSLDLGSTNCENSCEHHPIGCAESGEGYCPYTNCDVHDEFEDCESNPGDCKGECDERSPLVTLLLTALKANRTNLASLNLSKNGLATFNRGTALAHMLSTNTTLHTLSVSGSEANYDLGYCGNEYYDERQAQDRNRRHQDALSLSLEVGGTSFIRAMSGHWLQTNNCLTNLDISSNSFVSFAAAGNFPVGHIFAGESTYVPDFSSIVGFFKALESNK
jgi:hypothetical protein